MATSNQTIQIKRSSSTSVPSSLSFGELAFSDVGGVKQLYIGDKDSNVYLIKLTDFGAATSTIDANNNKIVNLLDATADSDAATWGQVQELINGLKWRTPVVTAVDTNINLTNPGTATLGGATLTTGDRVLVMGQTNTPENGIYIFDTTSTAMSRAADVNTLATIDTSAVLVDQGDKANNAYVLQVSNTSGTLGTEDVLTIAFSNSAIESLGANLSSIKNLTGLANGDLLYYSGAGFSKFSPAQGSVLTANSSGVITSVIGTDGDLLVRSGGVWTTGNTINGGTF